MIGAFLLRVVAPQVLPQHYAVWLVLAACGWLIGFGILAWRLIPVPAASRASTARNTKPALARRLRRGAASGQVAGEGPARIVEGHRPVGFGMDELVHRRIGRAQQFVRRAGGDHHAVM
jgi:hypothetical protein